MNPAYDISTSEAGDYVLVSWHGRARPSDLVKSGEEAWSRASEQGLSKILVDVRGIENTLSPTVLFASTEKHSALGPPRPRGALVGRPDQQKDLHFIETVGRNRGMPLKAFIDLTTALQWLEVETGSLAPEPD